FKAVKVIGAPRLFVKAAVPLLVVLLPNVREVHPELAVQSTVVVPEAKIQEAAVKLSPSVAMCNCPPWLVTFPTPKAVLTPSAHPKGQLTEICPPDAKAIPPVKVLAPDS